VTKSLGKVGLTTRYLMLYISEQKKKSHSTKEALKQLLLDN